MQIGNNSNEVITEQKLSSYADALLRRLICNRLNIRNENIKFYRNKNGKPYLESLDLHFNVSHSHNAIVIAIFDEEVGVDIEKICGYDNDLYNGIAEHLFTETENQCIKNSANKARTFYEIWTRKEAYIKLIGGSLANITEFNINAMPIESMTTTMLKDEYMITVCSPSYNAFKLREVDEIIFEVF
jgi:4'-phosphopantetheinyl transferase